MKPLEEIRKEIDQLDQQLVNLIVQRMEIVSEVAEAKRATGKAVNDPVRERAILKRLSDLAGESHAEAIREIYASMFKVSKARQDALLGTREREHDNRRQFGKLGCYLTLQLFGASHAPSIGMQLEHFPRGFQVDMSSLQAFMERRAPGRDPLSTARKEPDLPLFTSGIQEGVTTGDAIKATIETKDARSADYEPDIPRPGHADYTQWIQTGRILPGGGLHSGRMTAPLCIAGGICLQWLEQRHICISARLMAAGENMENPEAEIAQARQDGDSVGGLIEITVQGMKPGLGGPMFKRLEGRLASGLLSIPGTKGIEFGDGFEMAAHRGSEVNDPLAWSDHGVQPLSNHHGGILGGISSGMPLVIRLAMKPTPSIYKPQQTIRLTDFSPVDYTLQGRHDPCIARRALPVAEAMTAFVLTDLMLENEACHPRICLTLTGSTLKQNLRSLSHSRPLVDLCELRVDCLADRDQLQAASFPELAGLPVILTLRRSSNGGSWTGSEEARVEILEQLLSSSAVPFAYIDLESDMHIPHLEETARRRGTRIIRSLHNFSGPVDDLVACACQLKGASDEIPKIAFMANRCSDLERMFRDCADFTAFPHIICAMGAMGTASRLLAFRTHSLFTYCSPEETQSQTASIGHLTPQQLVRTYGLRWLDSTTELYAVTGNPLGHTKSPELHNEAFAREGWNAIMVPLQADSAEEVLSCAETLGIRGLAVTVPHKKAMLSLMTTVSPEAAAIEAVNTVIRIGTGWHGANTDIPGFRQALTSFLECNQLSGRKVAILGAGGAATAVAYVIAQLGGDACIFNRTLIHAKELASRYHFRAEPLAPETADVLSDYSDIIIQATSVGLSSHLGLSDPIPYYRFKGHEQLFDLIYSPEVTPVMARAKKAGCRVENGFAMLREQAVEQRKLFRTLAK